MLGMDPAHQRFEAVETGVRHQHLGLQKGDQLAVVQRLLHILGGEGELHPLLVFPVCQRIAMLQHVAQIALSQRL